MNRSASMSGGSENNSKPRKHRTWSSSESSAQSSHSKHNPTPCKVRPKKQSRHQSSKLDILPKSKKGCPRSRSTGFPPPTKDASNSSNCEKPIRKSHKSKKTRSLSSDELWQKCITQLEDGSEDAKRLHELAMQTAALEAEKLKFRHKVLEKHRAKNGAVKDEEGTAERRVRSAGTSKGGRYKETDVEIAEESNSSKDLSEASCARAASSRELVKSDRPKKMLKREYDENSVGPIDDLPTGSKEAKKTTEYLESVESSKRARKSKKNCRKKKAKKEEKAKKSTKDRKSTKNDDRVESSSKDKSGCFDFVADKLERQYYFGANSSDKIPSNAILRWPEDSSDESEKMEQKAQKRTKKRLKKMEQMASQKVLDQRLASQQKSVEIFENQPHSAKKKESKCEVDRKKYRSAYNKGHREHRSERSDISGVKHGRSGGKSEIFCASKTRCTEDNINPSEERPDASKKKNGRIRVSKSRSHRSDKKEKRSASQLRPSLEEPGPFADAKQLQNSTEQSDDQKIENGYAWPSDDPANLLEVKNEKSKKEKRSEPSNGSKKKSKGRRSAKKSTDLSSQSSVSTVIDPAELICCLHGRICPEGKREQKAERKRRRKERRKERKNRSKSSKPSQSKKSAHSLKRVFQTARREKSKSSKTGLELYEESPIWDEKTTKTCNEKGATSPYEMSDIPVEPVLIEPKKARKKKENDPEPDLDGEITFSEFFLGAMDQFEAEGNCDTPTAFKFYYMIDEHTCFEFLDPYLPLYIVYRDSAGSAWHFPIVQVTSNEDTFFHVNYNHDGAPRFRSIAALIKFYSVYVHFNQNEYGEMITDVFPWWYLYGKGASSKLWSDF